MAGAAARYAAFTSGSWFKDHDVILNTLERENKGIFLTLAAFEGTVQEWEGVPVIFALKHPNMDVFEEDPELAIAQVEGKIVGKVKAPYIDMVGHPWLAATLSLDDDAGLEHLITPPGGGPGVLSLSTGFWHGGLKKDKDLPVPVIQGPVIPQHVLVFPEDATSNDVPGDKGSFIINMASKEDKIVTDESEALSLFDKAVEKVRATFKAKPKPVPAALQDPPEGEAAAVPAAGAPIAEVVEAAAAAVQGVVEAEIAYDPEKLAKELAAALALVAELKARITELEGTTAAAEETAAELKWTEMKGYLPEGIVHGDKEAPMRKLWAEDPQGFALMASKLLSEDLAELPGKEGAAFTADETEGGGEPAASVGWPDPATGIWS